MTTWVPGVAQTWMPLPDAAPTGADCACTGAAITRLRSEERRVGKECIYQCDWSSDVCSSDLDDDLGAGRSPDLDAVARRGADRRGLRLHGRGDHEAQIGRASCRERVYISV